MCVSALVTVFAVAGLGCDNSRQSDPTRKQASPSEPSARPVLVYCSADAEFAEPILKDYAKRLNIEITPLFDTEAGKTTGLVNRLMAEKARPRADIWWSSEIFGTIALAKAGVLAEYRPPTASDIPDAFRDPDGRWTAFALRGRVVAFDPKRTFGDSRPKRWTDLADPRYAGRIALADPRFGTTRGHMAALLHVLGESHYRRFLEGLRDNRVRIADGNAAAMRMLIQDTVELAVTDTDDVFAMQAAGNFVERTVPDLSSNAAAPIGGLWIPCTAALVSGGPNPDAAKQVIDLLVSADTERSLFASNSRNIPVRRDLRLALRTETPVTAKIDYRAVAEGLDRADTLAREILLP